MKNLVIYREKEQGFGWNASHAPFILLISSFVFLCIIAGISDFFHINSPVDIYVSISGYVSLILSVILQQRHMKAATVWPVSNPESGREALQNAKKNEKMIKITAGIMIGFMVISMIFYLWLIFG